MFNSGVPALYTPKENGFLKRQRKALVEKIKALAGKKDLLSHHKIRVLTKKLDGCEKKLGLL